MKAPRFLRKRKKAERKRIIIEHIKKNPGCGQTELIKSTGVKIQGTFKNIREAYKVAGITYFRSHACPGWSTSSGKKEDIVSAIEKDPYLTAKELSEKLDIKNIFSLFADFNEIYKKAGVKKVEKHEKIRKRNRKKIVDYIQKNHLATQREINKACKTHVQELFKNGIFDAFKAANVIFPFERLRLYGVGLEKIRKRAKSFEDEIAIKLTRYGTVNRLVKTKRGFADIILERKGQKIVIEVKDYQNKDISISQVKQLNKYLEDINSNVGILICHKKPKKDKFIMGDNKIVIIEKQEIFKLKDFFKDL